MQVVEVCEFPPASAHKIPLHAGISLNKIWMADCIEQINLVWLNEREWLQFTLVVCYFPIQTYNTQWTTEIYISILICVFILLWRIPEGTEHLNCHYRMISACIYPCLHILSHFPPFTGFLLSHFSFYGFKLQLSRCLLLDLGLKIGEF